MVATSIRTMRKHIFLHPVDKKRRHAALKAALLKNKKKYSDKLEGALLDVKNVKVVGKHHLVVDGYMSMEVEADFTVFTPRPGLILKGVINKQSFSHLGCLVMDIFNASLSIPTSKELIPNIGDVVSFVVTEVVVDGDILFMRGSLESIISHKTPLKLKSEPEPEAEAGVKPEPIDFLRTARTIKTEPAEDSAGDPQEPEPSGSVVVKREAPSPDPESPSKSKKKKKKKKEN